ncbi:MAG: Cleavage polyadenylation factor subunit clp1 [Sclerophora amabilis]|nr:MAG: Cleavage polyadenylation factor subunit clp1 [Sclerophora amabilis]
MSLPGLQLTAPVEVSVPATLHELQKGSEWRFEVAFGSSIEVKLLKGTAEIFGTELAVKQTYTFRGTKAAIYTWDEHGCQLEVTGYCQVEYIAEETPMTSYANTHFALERLRQQATVEDREGPRVLVVGPDNAGKTSLVKILTAYATRARRQPVVVNLDPREGMLSLPGSLTATVFSSIVDVEEGWGSSPTSGPSPVPVKLPLAYYYGLASPEENGKLYKPIATRLALAVTSRLAEDQDAKDAGCIIDTSGVISQGKGGYDIINHIVSEFSVNVLLVLGSERLYSDLLRRFDGSKISTDETITVVKLAKSGGCVDRDDSYLQQARHTQMKEYFFGDPKRQLSPYSQQVDFNQLTIYKIHESTAFLSALLPGGGPDDSDSDEYTPAAANTTNFNTIPGLLPTTTGASHSQAHIFEKVTPSPLMQNSVLAIMHAAPHDAQETIRDASVMGFVYVDEVDEKRRKMRVLAPMAGRLPARAMVWGSWPEQVVDLSG